MNQVFANYINGEWVDRHALFENRNPADSDEVVGSFVKGTAQDVEDAVSAAAAALPAWSVSSGPPRGKTLPEANGEVRRSINIFRYFAGEGARMPGMLVPSERERVHMFALRKPIGVTGLVTPWNFPSAIPADRK